MYTKGWHIDAICDHLEAVTNGDIDRLLINVPPGTMKSLATNVFWPAWEWGPRNMPGNRYVCASYSQDLTIRDNRRTRTLVKSKWYQALWGNRVQIDPEQDSKIRFDTTRKGFKVATSVGGLGTGERGDRVIIDDPHNIKEGDSETVLKSTLLWFTEVMPTRLNDPRTSPIIIIMQRVNAQDVSGHVIANELGYTHLMLPMEFEPERKCIIEVTGFEDPRTEENELLWKERMPRRVVERDKKVLGSYATAGQYQQRPAPRGGGMFKTSWFNIINVKPFGGKAVRAWDLAATDDDANAAWTVGFLMRRTPDLRLVIEDIIRFRGSPHKVEKALYETAENDGHGVYISIPQDPGQAGKAQKASFAKLLMGYNVHFSPETGDKALRAQPFAAQAEAGNVDIIRAEWNGVFFDEAEEFPASKFKDQFDAGSRAFNFLIPRKRSHRYVAPELITNEYTEANPE